MTKGKELPLGMTDISGNCVSFVSNHHVKTDLGVTVEISTRSKLQKTSPPCYTILNSSLHSALGVSSHLETYNIKLKKNSSKG